ncbi:hypothetical protein BDZ45DRAFT_433290 [Acephala macrosclerotiorum]|nr:hypothetical protein BDZ45DRAFT_433290 [Acephala macrosclerotiorum]
MHDLDYGKLAPWQERSAHALDVIGFPRAILVLEVQMRLSEILKAIAERLVEGGKEVITFSQALELSLKKLTDKSNCVEFASVFINQAFSAPPTFDIQSMMDIAQAKVNLHADHLWLLQTDPLFLRRYAKLVLDGGFSGEFSSSQSTCLGSFETHGGCGGWRNGLGGMRICLSF